MKEQFIPINRCPSVYIVSEKLSIRANTQLDVAHPVLGFKLFLDLPNTHTLTIKEFMNNALKLFTMLYIQSNGQLGLEAEVYRIAASIIRLLARRMSAVRTF